MGQTYHRYQKSWFDDEKEERTSKAAGKRNHSRRGHQIGEEFDLEEYEDDKYYHQYEHMLKKR